MLRRLRGLSAALMIAAWAALPAIAQQRTVPDTRTQVQLSLAPVVKQARPAVVNVYGTRTEKARPNPLLDDPFFQRFFGGNFGVPQDRVQRSLGSGVIVDPSGLVVTNHHVIDQMTEVKVSLADKREYEAEILLRDPRADLAVLRLKGAHDLPALPIGDSDKLEVGDFVIAVGNPFGVGQTVTQGIVSALARTQVGVSDYQSFIQTDAAINPGNSGGALVGMNGELVGINTAIFSKSGGSMGIGFAIPSAMVKIVLQSARNGGKTVQRPWFGGTVQAVTADMTEPLGLDRPTGVLVSAIVAKGPADAAGLRRGDVVTAIDGLDVEDPDGFGYRFATRALGGMASFSVLRDGKKIVVPVKLAPPPETKPRDTVVLKGRTPLTGASAVNLSPATADELSLHNVDDGVALSDIAEDSTAAQVGFKKGDVIVAINDTKIDTTRDLSRILDTRPRYWEITVNRGGQVLTTAFNG